MIPKVTIAILDLSVKSGRSGHRMDLVDQEVDLVDQEGDLEVDPEDLMDPEEGLVDQVEDLGLVDQDEPEVIENSVEAEIEATTTTTMLPVNHVIQYSPRTASAPDWTASVQLYQTLLKLRSRPDGGSIGVR